MREARWGLFLHFIGEAGWSAEDWNRQVDAFDVHGLARQLHELGAGYFCLTIGQNSGHFCAPNATYDKLVGITPSKCSRRDLIADLAVALEARNMRLMVYLPSGAPAADPVARLSCRPDFMVLIYPVVTMGEKTNGGSKTSLLGPDPKPELIELFSNEKQVTGKTPPTFLAHAKDDTAVPPENSRMFVEALKSHNVPAGYLELPCGGHGLNGCKGPLWEEWKAKSLEWLAAQGIIPCGRSQTNAHES